MPRKCTSSTQLHYRRSLNAGPIDHKALEVMWYQPGVDRWRHIDFEIPSRRWMFQTARNENGIWMFGGFTVDQKKNETQFPRSVLLFDPTADRLSFSSTQWKLPKPRFSFASTQIGEHVFLVGGYRSKGVLSKGCDVFNLRTRQWSSIPAPPEPRVRARMVALNGQLYVAGGKSPEADGSLATNSSLWQYDLLTKKWTVLVDELPVSTPDVHLFALRHQLLCFTIEPQHNFDFQLCAILPRAKNKQRSGAHVAAADETPGSPR